MRLSWLLLFFLSTNALAHPCIAEKTLTPLLTAQLEKNQQYNSIWQVLKQNFAFKHLYDRKEVKPHTQWLANNLHYLANISQRAAPFLKLIVDEIKKQNLPIELALLPMIESAMLIYAKSNVDAAGIWQLRSIAAKDLKLPINYWYDGRYDILRSTQAALKYLHKLFLSFDKDWFLAIAAYNSGMGRVKGLLDKKFRFFWQPSPYWDLNLPKQTKHYVPSLLALAEWIDTKNLNELPPIENCAVLTKITINQPIDLYDLSVLFDMDIKTLYQYNPGISQWMTPPDTTFELLVPKKKLRHTTRYIQKKIANLQARIVVHSVEKNESLIQVAKQYNVHPHNIQSSNQLVKNGLSQGQTLKIYLPKKPPNFYVLSRHNRDHFLTHRDLLGAKKTLHTVQKGETLWSIAKQYGTNFKQLAIANNLKVEEVLLVGERLIIWQSLDPNIKLHWILPGDSLSHIAQAYGIEINTIIKANQLASDILYPGQVLRLPINAN